VSEPALRFENASFGYGPCAVLRGVDLVFPEGSLAAVVGPNGSGKTTLVRGAARVVEPLEGRVLLHGRPVATLGRRELARSLAVVPQEGLPALPWTVLEVVLMGRAPWVAPFSFEGEEDLRAAREALAAVGAEGLADRDAGGLSGGERQRVVVARALAQGSRVLLADEPTAHLDLRHALALFGLLRALAHERGLAVVVVTHDLNLAALHADRVAVLAGGRVEAVGRPAEVLEPGLLGRAFGASLRVERRPDGTPFVVPEAAPDGGGYPRGAPGGGDGRTGP
jgi:iron complex transport system ATP-binding protein